MARKSWSQCLVAGGSLISLWDGTAAQGITTCNPGTITDYSTLSERLLQSCDSALANVTLENFVLPSAATSLKLPFKTVHGSLLISNITATSADGTPASISLDISNLSTVTQALVFQDLQLSSMPALAQLTEARSLTFDSVQFRGSGSPGVEYDHGVYGDMTFHNCSGLTRISSNLAPNSPDLLTAEFVAVENQNLAEISLSGYGELSTNVVIQRNPLNPSVALRDMVTASFNIDSISSLSADILTSMGFAGGPPEQAINSTSLNTLELPGLQDIISDLSITDRYRLTAVSFPNLLKISSLNITSSQLMTVDFTALTTVGNLFLSAPKLQNITYPANVSISRAFDIQSENQSICSRLPKLKGDYSCGTAPLTSSSQGRPSPATSEALPASSGSSDSGSGGGSSSLSTGAKIGIGIGVGLGGLLALIGLGICLLRRRKTKAGTTRNPSSKEYYTSSEPEQVDRSPVRYSKAPAAAEGYSKVPASSDGLDDTHPTSQRPMSHHLPDDWSPPDQPVPTAEGRVELEEQQGPRHEMDARSLPDIDLDADDGEDTRSLQDIERAHWHDS